MCDRTKQQITKVLARDSRCGIDFGSAAAETSSPACSTRGGFGGGGVRVGGEMKDILNCGAEEVSLESNVIPRGMSYNQELKFLIYTFSLIVPLRRTLFLGGPNNR